VLLTGSDAGHLVLLTGSHSAHIVVSISWCSSLVCVLLTRNDCQPSSL